MSAFIDSCDPEAIQDDTMYLTVPNPGSPRPWWWRDTAPWTPTMSMQLVDININPILIAHRSLYWHGLCPVAVLDTPTLPWRND